MEIKNVRIAGTNPKFDGYVVTMKYTIRDSDDQLTDSSTITIKVQCLRAPPVAIDDRAEQMMTHQ